MGFTRRAREIWRDYTVEGVPGSGAHAPSKSELRQYGRELESQLTPVTAGLPFDWATSTSGDPGAGKVAVNNGTLTSATHLRISKTGALEQDYAAVLALLDDSSNPTGKGTIQIVANGDQTKWLRAVVTALADNTGYVDLTITAVAAGVAFAANDSLTLNFAATGDQGVPGNQGPTGAAGDATPHLYDRENGVLPTRGAIPIVASGGAALGTDFRVTIPVGGDFGVDITLDAATLAAGKAFVELRLDAGTLSDAYIDQYNGASVIAGTTQNLGAERDRKILRAITLNGSATKIRVRLKNIGGSVTAITSLPGVGPGTKEPREAATDPWGVSLDNLLVDDANTIASNFAVSLIGTVTGTPGTVTGTTIACGAETQTDFRVPLAGIMTGADTFLMLFKANRPVANVQATPHTGISGGGATPIPATYMGSGWYKIAGSAAGAAGADAAYMDIRVDNRSTIGITAGSLTLSKCWIGKNAVSAPSMLSVPAVANKALADAGVLTVYVSLAGSNSNAGSRIAPVATLAEAVARGATRIGVRKSGIHRITSAIVLAGLAGVEVFGYAESGDTDLFARIFASVNYPAASWTNDATYTNLYYLTGIAANPGGLHEVSAAGVYTRITHRAKASSTPSMMAADLTTANGGGAIDAVVATSATSVTPSVATKTLTTSIDGNGHGYVTSGRVRITSRGNSAIWMEGAPTAWLDGTLTVAVDRIGTATAAADWDIAPVGQGSLFYDSGTSRLYMRPIADSISGKSYEVPLALNAIQVSNGGLVLREVEIAHSRDDIVQVTNGSIRAEATRIGRSGSQSGGGNGIAGLGNATLIVRHCIVEDCGNDGVNTVGDAIIEQEQSVFRGNRGDGSSPHGSSTQWRAVGCRYEGNGKNGWVSVGGGATTHHGCVGVGNAEADFFLLPSSSGYLNTVALHGSFYERCSLQGNAGAADAALLATITDARGCLYVEKAQVGVRGLRGHGDGTGSGSAPAKSQFGVRLVSGALTVEDFHLARYGFGLMLAGGVLTLKDGHLLRSVNGQPVFITGGTLITTTADPINIWDGAAFTAWAASHAYALGDPVTSSGQGYICTTAHTSGGSFDSTKFTPVSNVAAI